MKNFAFIFLISIFFSLTKGMDIEDLRLNLKNSNDIDIDDLIILVNLLLSEISNVTFTKDSYKICIKKIVESINLTQRIFSASGKFLGDFGFEDICNGLKELYDKNISYFLLNFTLNISEFNETSQFNELYFLNESKSIMGLCMFDECNDFLNDFINVSLNPKFQKFLQSNASIENGTINFVNNETFDTINKKNNNSFWYIIFFSFISFIIFIFLFINIYTIIEIFLRKEEKKIKVKPKESMTEEIKDDNYDEYMVKKEEKYDEIMTELQFNICSILFKIKFTKIFPKLFTLSNDLYNNKGLEPLAFIRCIIAFFITYYYTFYSLVYFPPKDQFNPNFYHSLFFSLIKLSGMSFIGFIILDGAVMSYKLMCKVRNYLIYEVNSDISFSLFFKFFLGSVSNILVFFVIFIIFYNCCLFFNYDLNIKYLSLKNLNDFGFLFDYYAVFFLNKENTIYHNNIYELLYLPLKYVKQSLDFYSNLNKNNITKFSVMSSLTYDFVYISINEFYSFIIALIIIYICCKTRSKKLDKLIGIIFLIYYISVIIFFYKFTVQNKVYDIKYNMILNQHWYEKNPFLFINIYLTGVIIGIMYFYYKDMKSNVQLFKYYEETENENPPLYYCSVGVKKIFNMKEWIKNTLLWISVVLIFISSFLFQILLYLSNDHWAIYEKEKNDSEFKKTIINFYYHYTYFEKLIYMFLLCIILLMLLTPIKSSLLYNLLHFNIFNFIERESRVILCCSQAVLLLCVCVFRFQFVLAHKTFFIHSIGNFIFILFTSSLVTFFFEIPIKIIVKLFTRVGDWEAYNMKELTNEVSDENLLLIKEVMNDNLIRESNN